MSRRRTVLARVLFAVAAVLSVLALLAGWVRGQVLDEQRYVDTSAAVLADGQVRSATAAYLADQLVEVPGIEAQLAQRLPGITKAAAAPATARIRDATERAASKALSSSAFQTLWREANAASYRQLRRAIEDGQRGALVLDLRPLLSKLAVQVGLEGRTIANLPERAGVIRILTADEVDDVRRAARALQLTAWALALAALLALAGGAFTAPSRAAALRGAGLALLIAGIVVLITRRLVGGALIDEVVTDGSVATAGKQTWWILTERLADLSAAMAAVGALLIIGGWVARRRGPRSPR